MSVATDIRSYDVFAPSAAADAIGLVRMLAELHIGQRYQVGLLAPAPPASPPRAQRTDSTRSPRS